MDTIEIVNIVLSIAPSIIAVCTTLGAVIKMLKELKGLHQQVNDTKITDELNDQIKSLITQNIELKKQINEALTKIDHVDRSKK